MHKDTSGLAVTDVLARIASRDGVEAIGPQSLSMPLLTDDRELAKAGSNRPISRRGRPVV